MIRYVRINTAWKPRCKLKKKYVQVYVERKKRRKKIRSEEKNKSREKIAKEKESEKTEINWKKIEVQIERKKNSGN